MLEYSQSQQLKPREPNALRHDALHSMRVHYRKRSGNGKWAVFPTEIP